MFKLKFHCKGMQWDKCDIDKRVFKCKILVNASFHGRFTMPGTYLLIHANTALKTMEEVDYMYPKYMQCTCENVVEKW